MNAAARQRVSTGALMAALLTACIAFQLNASMLSPALVTMQKELHTDAAAIGLTQTAFFTAAALFSLFLPRLGDIAGRKKVLTAMLILLTVGCVLAALAPNVQVLFIARIVQGVSGPVVPLCLIMLRVEITEPRTYGTLMGVITSVNGGIAGVDALAGGFLAENYGYASIFWTMAVIGVIASLLLILLARESTADQKTTMDWLGVLPLVISVGALLIALNEAGKLGQANWPMVIILFVLAAAAFVVFWRIEGHSSHPLVATYLLRRRSTWSLLLTTVLTMTGVFAVMNALIPALAQDTDVGFGLGASASALWTLTPYALAGLVMGPIAGRLASSFGYTRILRLGMLGSLLVLGLMIVTVHTDARALLLAVSILLGFSYAGTGNIMLNGLGIVLSPAENPGFLPGLNAGAFNLGSGLSFAIIIGAQTAAGGGVRGYDVGLIAGIVLLALALAASLLIPRPADAESGRHGAANAQLG